jgi:hypothetical protein
LPRQGRVCRRRRDRCGSASLRPNGSRAIGGLSTAFRTRTTRALGAMAVPARRPARMSRSISGRALRRTLEAGAAVPA